MLFAVLFVPTTASAAEVTQQGASEPSLTPGAALAVAQQRAEEMGSIEGKPTVSPSTVAAASATVMGVEAAPDGPVAAGLSGAAGAAPAQLVVLHGRFRELGAKVPEGVEQPQVVCSNSP